MGIALGTSAKPEILIAIPYVAVGVAVLLAQHHSVIGALLHFCTGELAEFLETLRSPENAPQWDNSEIAKRYASASMLQRSLGHFIILLLPCITGLLANIDYATKIKSREGVLWWGAVLATLSTFWVISRSHSFRSMINKELRWRAIKT